MRYMPHLSFVFLLPYKDISFDEFMKKHYEIER